MPSTSPCSMSAIFSGVSSAERNLGRGRPHLVRDQARRMRGAGRRIRFRKIGQRAVDPQAAAIPDRIASHRQHSLQGPRTARPVGARDSQHSRQRHFDHLPGADDVAQSAAYDRVPDRRDPAAAQRNSRRHGAGADARTAHPGRHSRAGNPACKLSASIIRRPAPAGDDRDGARKRARSADRR